jgi:hypothetical protein
MFGKDLEINVDEVTRQNVQNTEAQFIYVIVKLGLSYPKRRSQTESVWKEDPEGSITKIR